MKKIYKYKIDYSTTLELPKDGKIVLVGLDVNDDCCIWVEFKEENESLIDIRRFLIHGTGHTISEKEKHVGSFARRPLIWHLYELT